MRDAFVDAAAAIDGTGGAVAAAGRTGAGRDAGARSRASKPAQAEEAEQLGVELEAAGYPERTRRAQLRRLEERHKRAHRRARIDALLEGITALETVYRDALAGSPTSALNLDRDVAR